MSDNYPEYLNPFAEDLKPKRKLKIRNSFRELKETLRQSFRIKKEPTEKITLQPKSESFKAPPKIYRESQAAALPRSRFHERISLPPQSTQSSSLNPFEREEGEEEGENTSTRLLSVRRRIKKRAPMPPNKSLSSQNLSDGSLDVPGSQWSLTSVETNYSNLTDQVVLEKDEVQVKRQSMAENFADFSENMRQLSDDANNNIISKDETPNVPDLVSFCPNSDIVKNEGKKVSDVHCEKDTFKEDDDKRTNNDENDENLSVSQTERTDISDIKNQLNESDNEEPFLYHERQSLYITGSRDELNDIVPEPKTYVGQVSIYVTGSCDNLDGTNNNEVCSEEFSGDNQDAVPVPKQRKNKLTKNMLLGV